MKSDNNKICDINKVQYAELFFVNQYGNKRLKMPEHPSVRGDEFNPDAICQSSGGLSMIEYAVRNNMLDKWTPIAEFQYASNHYLSFIVCYCVSYILYYIVLFKREIFYNMRGV